MRTVDNVMNSDFIPAAVPIHQPIVSLTERGHRVLSLSRCREVLTASSTKVVAVFASRIAELLGTTLSHADTGRAGYQAERPAGATSG